MFVCVEVLRLSQPNGVMSSAVSLPNHTLLGRLSPLSGRRVSVISLIAGKRLGTTKPSVPSIKDSQVKAQ